MLLLLLLFLLLLLCLVVVVVDVVVVVVGCGVVFSVVVDMDYVCFDVVVSYIEGSRCRC